MDNVSEQFKSDFNVQLVGTLKAGKVRLRRRGWNAKKCTNEANRTQVP